ncbi:hypothetical protein BH11VER1_BH11VER1_06720 [soil metagenome]
MAFDQGQFNFEATSSEDGYRHWRQMLDEQRRALESRWGIIFGSRVSLKLMHRDERLEGIINLLSDEGKQKSSKLRLSLNGLVFSPQEIESVTRLDKPVAQIED